MKSLEIVISHFCEKLDWLKSFKSINKIIYEKGTVKKQNCPIYRQDIKVENLKVTRLDNIGRESHTYLYHIINNYNNLAEHTVFVQGNPLTHCSDIVCILQEFPRSLKKLFEFSKGCYCLCDVCLMERPVEWTRYEIFPDEVYKKFFSVENNWFLYGSGAQYIVHKKCITNKPLDFYLSLFDYLTQQYMPDPEKHSHVPWSLERLWPSIFDSDDKYGCKSYKKFKFL